MCLHRSTPPPCRVLQAPPRGFERVAHGDEYVFVRVIEFVLAVDDDLSCGNHEIDADVKHLALVLMPVRHVDHHVARRDAVVIAVEPRGILTDAFLNGRRRRGVAKRNL
jgi:hypothetical protein